MVHVDRRIAEYLDYLWKRQFSEETWEIPGHEDILCKRLKEKYGIDFVHVRVYGYNLKTAVYWHGKCYDVEEYAKIDRDEYRRILAEYEEDPEERERLNAWYERDPVGYVEWLERTEKERWARIDERRRKVDEAEDRIVDAIRADLEGGRLSKWREAELFLKDPSMTYVY